MTLLGSANHGLRPALRSDVTRKCVKIGAGKKKLARLHPDARLDTSELVEGDLF